MRKSKKALIMDARRRELRSIYGDTLWLVDHLRVFLALLENRGVQLTDEEEDYLEAAMRAIAAIQGGIENRLTSRELL